MKRIIKVFSIVFVLLIVLTYISNVYASNVNMNLSADNDSTIYGSNPNDSSNNDSNNSENPDNSQNSSVVVSNSTVPALDSLTISDMINIILCAIGIILILLGIAIIIRQKTA